MSDYERIYLQPECCADPADGRTADDYADWLDELERLVGIED